MKLLCLNNFTTAVKGKKQIKLGKIIPKGLEKTIVAQEVTSDFVLEIYEKAKRARSEKKKDTGGL